MIDRVANQFDKTLTRDMFDLLCGNVLGKGVTRTVYANNLDDDTVIKVEDNARSFQNIAEWQVRQSVKYADFHKDWFAPCHAISPCGLILIQGRTREPNKYPEKIPSYFTELKRDNYGVYKNRFVAHDYGLHLMLGKGMTKRMQSVVW